MVSFFYDDNYILLNGPVIFLAYLMKVIQETRDAH